MERDEATCLSHYEVLGAHTTADYAEIRSKYRAVILALHPDKFSGTAAELDPISEPSQNFRENYSLSSVGTRPSRDVETSVGDEDRSVGVPLRSSSITYAELGGEFRKNQSSAQEPEVCDDTLARFLRVQNAWEVLRDPRSRFEYDKYLASQRLANVISSQEEPTKVIGEDISILEMDWCFVNEDQETEYTYLCRCGDRYRLAQNVLKEVGYLRKDMGVSNCRDQAGEFVPTAGIRSEQLCEGRSLVLPCQSCSLHVRVHFV